MDENRLDIKDVSERMQRDENLFERKYIRYKDGSKRYSMSQRFFEKIARKAGAVYEITSGMRLVNTEIFEEYLENFRVVEEGDQLWRK